VLDFNEHEGNIAGVMDPVSGTTRDIDGASSPHIDGVAVKCDDAFSGNDEPMFRTA
jgi:hypothetical protein